MRNTSKILAVIAAVAAIGIVASVMKLGKVGPNSTAVQETNDNQTVQPPQLTKGSSTSTLKHVVRVTSAPVPSNQAPVTARATNENPMPPKVAAGQLADWDEKVSDVLGAEGDEK